MGLNVLLTLWSSPRTISQLIKLSRCFSPMMNWFLKSSLLKIIFGIIDLSPVSPYSWMYWSIVEFIVCLRWNLLGGSKGCAFEEYSSLHRWKGKKEKKGRDKNTLYWDKKKDVLKVLQELPRPYPLQGSVWKCKDFFLLEERAVKTPSFLGFTGMSFHQNSIHCTPPLCHMEVTPTVVQVQAGGRTYHCPCSADSAGMWSTVVTGSWRFLQWFKRKSWNSANT